MIWYEGGWSYSLKLYRMSLSEFITSSTTASISLHQQLALAVALRRTAASSYLVPKTSDARQLPNELRPFMSQPARIRRGRLWRRWNAFGKINNFQIFIFCWIIKIIKFSNHVLCSWVRDTYTYVCMAASFQDEHKVDTNYFDLKLGWSEWMNKMSSGRSLIRTTISFEPMWSDAHRKRTLIRPSLVACCTPQDECAYKTLQSG